MESLGELIKRTLKEKGIKEIFVANKMNVSKQVINQIDRRKNFDLKFLNDLKDATGLDFTKKLNSQLYQDNSKDVNNAAEESNSIYQSSKTVSATISMNFEIPASAYANLSEFMKEINLIANKHGLKVL